MERIKYTIQSKRRKPDGDPEFSKSGTSANMTSTINFHQFGLEHHCHPDPDMNTYAFKYGTNCFEYIIDPVEQAILRPKKEKRAT
jgi:hypothetical protein